MHTLLDKLLNGEFDISQPPCRTPQHEELLTLLDKRYNKLKGMVSAETFELIEDLIDLQIELLSLACDAKVRRGVRSGALLILELLCSEEEICRLLTSKNAPASA